MIELTKIIILSLQRIEETFGGIETFTFSLVKWLKRKEVSVSVVCRRLSLGKPIVILDELIKSNKSVSTINVKLPLVLYICSMVLYSFFSVLSLLKLALKREIGLIHAQDLSFSGFAGVILTKWFNIPLISHSHGPPMYILDKSFGDSLIWRTVERTLNKIVINNSNLILVTDKKTENIIKSTVKVMHSIVCLPTAIDFSSLEFIEISKKLSSKPKPLLGFIGRLSVQKNPQIILQAISLLQLNDCYPELFIVGDGPLRIHLEEMVNELKLSDRVRFFGFVSDQRKLELLHSIDIFIMPSFEEGCPIALLEAMGAGKAIIAANISSIREIVTHNKEAILINPQDVDSLKQAILLLYNNQAFRSNLALRAKQRAQSYCLDAVYGKLLKIYEAILENKHQKLEI